MSTRSFRDRYRNLARLAGLEAPDPAVLGEEWPTPDGFSIERSGLGTFAIREERIAGDHVDQARSLLESVTDSPIESHVFLDTETTGLSGGTGTYTFLIGSGRFIGNEFIVRQLFMRHPGEEIGTLLALERELADTSRLVTFNGRTFDVPLLVARFRMHHREFQEPPDHLDLLPPARAIWKHRLPSCSLGSLEHHILGVERELDVPGWEIPALYAAYLREKDPMPLEAVIAHNTMDILSLARLNAVVAGYQTGQVKPSSAADRVAVALMALRQSPNLDGLSRLLEECSHPAVPSVLRHKAISDASVHGKRLGCWELLTSAWAASLADASSAVRVFAAVELAKYHEHKTRDFQTALEIVERALDGVALSGDLEAGRELKHRQLRLLRKVNRS